MVGLQQVLAKHLAKALHNSPIIYIEDRELRDNPLTECSREARRIGFRRCNFQGNGGGILPLPGFKKLTVLQLYNCSGLSAVDFSNSLCLRSIEIAVERHRRPLVLKGLVLPVLVFLSLRNCQWEEQELSFCSLTEVYIQDCDWLEGWDFGDWYLYASLHKIVLENCKKLKRLEGFRGLRALEVLRVVGCPALKGLLDFDGCNRIQKINIIGGGDLELRGEEPQNLQELVIEDCMKVVVNRFVTSVETLRVWRSKLVLSGIGMNDFVNVEEFEVDCWEGVPDVGGLRKLRSLFINRCELLKSVPDLSKWRQLEVVDLSYTGLCSFPTTLPLPRLKRLRLHGCCGIPVEELVHQLTPSLFCAPDLADALCDRVTGVQERDEISKLLMASGDAKKFIISFSRRPPVQELLYRLCAGDGYKALEDVICEEGVVVRVMRGLMESIMELSKALKEKIDLDEEDEEEEDAVVVLMEVENLGVHLERLLKKEYEKKWASDVRRCVGKHKYLALAAASVIMQGPIFASVAACVVRSVTLMCGWASLEVRSSSSSSSHDEDEYYWERLSEFGPLESLVDACGSALLLARDQTVLSEVRRQGLDAWLRTNLPHLKTIHSDLKAAYQYLS